jgi:hypothetical protein
MYAKLINGNLTIAPKMLVIGDTHVWNATAEQYAAQGWLPVVYTDAPEQDGYYAESGWAEEEGHIVQEWVLIPIPEDEDIDDAEALQIILGGDES